VRVTLLHNPNAGRGEYPKQRLIRALREAGHEVIYRSTKSNKWRETLEDSTDIVMAAGGDGTVGKVARELIGRKTPLSVLPLGTANNLARTLGFDLDIERLIRQLSHAKTWGIDVGRVRGPCGKRYVFEGIGAGLLAEYLRQPRTGAPDLSKKEEMSWHVCALRQLLQTYQARRWKLKVDGEELDDRFLLLEAMNIRSVGPVLNLAPTAKASDGQFNLVFATEKERDILMDYLADRLLGRKTPVFPFPTRSFRRLRIRWKKSPLHFDDSLWPEQDEEPLPGEIELSIKRSALLIARADLAK
jgi:diacylglycerol kinase family enzyme